MRKNEILEILKLGAVLCAITFTVALVLAVANMSTEGRIAALDAKAQDEARKAVLPSAEVFEAVEVEGVGTGEYKMIDSVFAGKAGDDTVGYSIGVAPTGFSGAIDMIVGIDSEGKVTGIHIVNHQETPGLGSKALEPQFKDQYHEKSTANPLTVIKSGTPKDNEILSISGATVTSKAITQGVNAAAKIYHEQLDK
ncbi:MAG: RnfABCDGE type electron transport complex subunit G [Firmicutes bacterium]|nr:RnfABCDGE type electron transport complex subunit G [Bacillota bacterium]